ncbi:carboxymuconolactone decarboxylase family protein [Pontibacter sp. G13]|uniref:carboxymuconolactone decarboxylase family protein n=1 Tax=Pontibacter sp. G13 TaxID=3074898 RepID=UPI00288B1ADD|nr:carboxymuconolactone decarboxylase family protein [Pontibacter sp. G13]WNJ17375.1 carboxymuconolactone decarboxylase family protein [Pontibacter sp. G13]
MAYIETGVRQPGIVELLFYKGSSGKAISQLMQTLMKGPSPLSKRERELIAAHVSALNECEFCDRVHTAVACQYPNPIEPAPEKAAIPNGKTAPAAPKEQLSPKMKALLDLAGLVQQGGNYVSQTDIQQAQFAGASEEEIHDTVLIASAFCMINRYVDGLGAEKLNDQHAFNRMGEMLAKWGYSYPPKFLRPVIVWVLNRKWNIRKGA